MNLTSQHKWLVTGCAGFIGSRLIEHLLRANQFVVGLDNFSTGSKNNLEEVKELVGQNSWKNFKFIEGDIRRKEDIDKAFAGGIDFVLHQAALGSVTRSIKDPVASHESNVTGFINVLWAAKNSQVKKFVYASSSSVYGDHPDLPKKEGREGKALSPYALTKVFNESYAELFYKTYGVPVIGLRYFNVFGPRQNPEGPYAAVIPLWTKALLKGDSVFINGDGESSRDFCYVDNAVQANIKAALTEEKGALGQAFNVAVGARTTLNDLFEMIQKNLIEKNPKLKASKPIYREFREGDIRHSHADISKARELLGYQPEFTVQKGLAVTMDWYREGAK